jgi:signal transduction histidine kinase
MVRAWLAAPRRWLWSFVLLLLLPAAAVAWLGVELVRKDRQIEARNAEDQREILASRLLADIERLVSASERTLANAPRDLALTSADDAVVIDIEGDRVGPRPPSTLLYRPRLAHSLVGDTSPFEAAEILELRDKNVDAAIAAYRTLSLSSDRDVRAGALLRLARTLRTAGRGDDALRVYAELERHGTTRLDGLPADLVARHLSASLLHDLGHRGLTRAATSLLEDLFVPRWTLDQATFELYRDELSGWLGRIDTPPTGAEVLAETVDWFWHEAQRSSIQANDRRAVEIRGQGMTLLWQSAGDRLTVLVAGPRFRQRRWVEPVIGRPEYQGMGLTALTPGSEPAATALDGLRITRSPDQTGLPWISVVTSSVVTDMSALAPKRRTTLLAGLTLLLAVVLTAAYVMARSVARELAVARLQSDFVAAVSHEFRTPLTSLHQFIELLDEEEEPPPDKRRAFYRAQSRAAGRLTQLVESLLDFGRMEAGVHPFRMETLTVASFAREVIREFQRDGTLDEFSFDFEVGPGEELVWADREAVSRALRNLLENAVKYSGDSRRVTVGVRREQDAVAISVRDWGLGIPRDEQQEIFKKFVRGSASRVNGIPGTGIGLAMVRYIADVHRGRVVVESAIGHGSTFTIFLPATVPAGAPVVTSTTERQDIGSPESWHAS